MLQMLSSGLPELSTTEDIQYVSDALLPGRTEPEATFAFTKYADPCKHNAYNLFTIATPYLLVLCSKMLWTSSTSSNINNLCHIGRYIEDSLSSLATDPVDLHKVTLAVLAIKR